MPSRGQYLHHEFDSFPMGIGFAVAVLALLLPFRLARAETLNSTAFDRSIGHSEFRFERMPPEMTRVDFQMEIPEVGKRFRELLQLGALGGICTGDFNGDGLSDFYVTSPEGSGRLYQNLGAFRFKDVTRESGLFAPSFWGTGAAFVDIDNDGDLDLYTCAYRQANRLYINSAKPNESIHFENQAPAYGLDFVGGSMNMVFADMDLDGDLDAYLATTAVPPPSNIKFRVQFEGKKPIVPEELREYWGLIYLPGDRAHPTENGQFDRLFEQDGKRFKDVTENAGITGPHLTLAAIWWDYNSDGWPDLYVANDYMGPDKLYLNQRDGTFRDTIQSTFPHTPWSSMGVDIGDLNNDGLADLIASDMLGTTHYRRQAMQGESSKKTWFLEFAKPRQYGRNAVSINSGADRFFEVAYQTGMAATDWTWAPRIADFDNDGRSDVYFTNGMIRDVQHADLANYADRTFKGGSQDWAEFWSKQRVQQETNLVFQNHGNLSFRESSKEWGLNHKGVSFGSATADFDNDGDLDLIVNNVGAPISIYQNHSTKNRSIRVQLQGTTSNRIGLGARVRVQTSNHTQTQWITHSRGWLSGSDPIAHFGLGKSEKIDSLEIKWPSGKTQTFENLPADRIYTVTEDSLAEGSGHSLPRIETPLYQTANPFEWIRRETTIQDDYAKQPLLPGKISSKIAAIATSDFDNDGDDDIYIGGAFGQAGIVLRQGQNNSWERTDLTVSSTNRDLADSDAILADVDGDGIEDLFVIRSLPPNSPPTITAPHDLYLNRGDEGFVNASKEWLPSMTGSASCVTAADFDRDGDIDFFLGGSSIPGRYPLAFPSRLLVNESGQLHDRTPPSFKSIGLATDAIWTSSDRIARPDLWVSTEWGPVRHFQNKEGRFVEQTKKLGLHRKIGLWKCLEAADFDRDGDVDIVVGNLGRNTRYQANEESPQTLLFGDFGTGREHLIESYQEADRLLPHRGFESLSRSLPFLRQQFINFHEYSSATIEEMIPPDRLNAAIQLKVNTVESGIWWNEGENQYRFHALPPLAQSSPINDIVVTDTNGDHYLDLVLAQNDFSPQAMTGRLDGGMSLILLAETSGGFEALMPNKSGIVINDDPRRIAQADLNGDDQKDLLFIGHSGPPKVFIREAR